MNPKYPIYRKVASSSLFWLVAHFQIFRRLMKGKFYAYVLWPLDIKFQNWIVDRSTACNFTVLALTRADLSAMMNPKISDLFNDSGVVCWTKSICWKSWIMHQRLLSGFLPVQYRLTYEVPTTYRISGTVWNNQLAHQDLDDFPPGLITFKKAEGFCACQ